MPDTNKHSGEPARMGIDVGTSGIRTVILDSKDQIIFQSSVEMPFPDRNHEKSEQLPSIWISALEALLQKSSPYLNQVTQLIVDATSSTVLLVDDSGNPLSTALMYDDKRAADIAKQIKSIGPVTSGAHGASSSLAKVLWLEQNHRIEGARICHQVDYVNHFLSGILGVTDENNVLKLGYDSVHQIWPNWVKGLLKSTLPEVVAPGAEIGVIRSELIEQYGFNSKCRLYAGTTDSIAAFLASGANQIGDAVSSLGSTLAIKLLSDRPVFSPEYGIYSHKLNNQWLAGGASNTGGATLLHFFSLEKLTELLPLIDIRQPTDLGYYPLIGKGERFPIADPDLEIDFSQRPESNALFLQGLIEGLVEVEKSGYERLEDLGSPKVKRIFTAGGGNKNSVWMTLREMSLSAQIAKAANIDAAFGVTRLLS